MSHAGRQIVVVSGDDGLVRINANCRQEAANASGVVIAVTADHQYGAARMVSDGAADRLAAFSHGRRRYAAGVDDHQVARLVPPADARGAAVGRFKARRRQRRRQSGAVVLVDLAAQGCQKKSEHDPVSTTEALLQSAREKDTITYGPVILPAV